MPTQLKIHTVLTFILAILFYLFFQISKHNPALSQVNAFAEDPYDAVGSFGVLLALFTALLSLVRAFRPYQTHQALEYQKVLLVRGEALSCLSVAVTLIADIVAMIRYPALWVASSAGRVLVALVGGMVLFTVLVSWLICRSARRSVVPFVRSAWTRAIGISFIGIIVLALYPVNWRQSILGELFTVVVGMVILFVSVWALGVAISPSVEMQYEDFIDDLASVYHWFKTHAGRFVVLYNLFEKVRGWSLVHSVLNWLNPRKHTWNLVLLLGVFIGGGLALAEALGEGISGQIGQLVIVSAIFVGFGWLGVLLGYALLAQPLGLFRHVSTNER